MTNVLRRSKGVTKLFVYGSLQPGGANEHMLASIRGTWEPGTVRGRLKQLGWGAGIGYPGLVLDAQGEEIRGHLLTSPKLREAWRDLDRFEGAEYRRVTASVTVASGKAVQAWVYTLRSV